MKNFDIVTFGSAVIDVFVHTDCHEKGKEMCYPVGGKLLIKKLMFDVGGGGTNTAVAFSRLGFKTGCITNVGNDENGRRIVELLKKEKVDFLGKIDKKGMTGYSVILDSTGGERTILTYKGVNNDISFKDISSKKFNTKWLYYSALLGKSFNTQKILAFRLLKKGTKIAFNPSSYIINNLDISDLLKITYVIILNKEEAESLCKKYKKPCENILEELHELGVKIVVVTDKDNPAICFDGIRKYSVKPHKNIRVVERTGAGDAFASGFIAGCLLGWPIKRCLELGLKESESVIQFPGAKNNLIKMNIKRQHLNKI
ncbi:MAG: carbohydrate kinase family protein [Candidatus Pacearchaeota archaeon]